MDPGFGACRFEAEKLGEQDLIGVHPGDVHRSALQERAAVASLPGDDDARMDIRRGRALMPALSMASARGCLVNLIIY